MRVVIDPKEDQLIVISEGGQVIRMPIENIPDCRPADTGRDHHAPR